MTSGILSGLDRYELDGLGQANGGEAVLYDDVRDVLLDHKTREVIRTVLWRHKKNTGTRALRKTCTCGNWVPEAEPFEMHLAEELQKALAGGDT